MLHFGFGAWVTGPVSFVFCKLLLMCSFPRSVQAIDLHILSGWHQNPIIQANDNIAKVQPRPYACYPDVSTLKAQSRRRSHDDAHEWLQPSEESCMFMRNFGVGGGAFHTHT